MTLLMLFNEQEAVVVEPSPEPFGGTGYDIGLYQGGRPYRPRIFQQEQQQKVVQEEPKQKKKPRVVTQNDLLAVALAMHQVDPLFIKVILRKIINLGLSIARAQANRFMLRTLQKQESVMTMSLLVESAEPMTGGIRTRKDRLLKLLSFFNEL